MRVLRGKHSFPHRRITWRVRRARKSYGCDSIERTAHGHTETIPAGSEYVGVGIRPDVHQPRGWTHLKLCLACGASFELVDLEPEATT